jgi:hypothetical protein
MEYSPDYFKIIGRIGERRRGRWGKCKSGDLANGRKSERQEVLKMEN